MRPTRLCQGINSNDNIGNLVNTCTKVSGNIYVGRIIHVYVFTCASVGCCEVCNCASLMWVSNWLSQQIVFVNRGVMEREGDG